MSKIKRPFGVSSFWRFHLWIYNLSDGRIGSSMMGHKVLKLITRGHKSGKLREILIYYFRSDSGYVIVASNLGADRHPAWYRNLQADPHAKIQIGRRKMDVTARTAEGAERERLWSLVVTQDKMYAGYKEQTERRIPLVILEPMN